MSTKAGLALTTLAILLLAIEGWLLGCLIKQKENVALDDAYITYVYGRNLAEGAGLRYNATDAAPTEGFSSVLHVLLVAAAERGGIDPLVATRAAGLLFFLTIPLALALALVRIVRIEKGLALLAGTAVNLGLILWPETARHLTAGMETGLFAALHVWVLVWVAAFALARQPRRREIAAVALGFVLLVLARPEGPLLALFYLCAIPVARRVARLEEPAPITRSWLILFATLVAAVGGFLLWRWTCFGHLLPNPFYVKARNAIFGSAGHPLPGLSYVTEFLILRALPLGILLLGLAHAAAVERRARAVAAILLAPSAAVVGAYTRAIHETAESFRYEFPLAMSLLVAIAVALGAVARRSRRGFAWLTLALVALPLLALPAKPDVWHWATSAPRYWSTSWLQHRQESGPLAQMGLDLAETGLGQDATILLSGAGLVPYLSRFQAIDWIGLNDTTLSGRVALDMDQVWDYIESRRPDVVYSILPPASPGIDERQRDPAFLSPGVQRTLGGRGSELFRHWNPDRVAAMFYREMRYVRDRYEFGAAYDLGAGLGRDWMLMAYVRVDSAHRARLLQVLSASRRADRDTDMSRFYAIDPRTHRPAPR